MNRFLPFFVTAALALSSLWASLESYAHTRARIAHDLTRALALTAGECPADWLATDTIRAFRSHLQTEALRPQAYLVLCPALPADGSPRRAAAPQPAAPAAAAAAVWSDSLTVAHALQARGYAACSPLAVWWMSDQRLAALLATLCLLMMVFGCRRRPGAAGPAQVSGTPAAAQAAPAVLPAAAVQTMPRCIQPGIMPIDSALLTPMQQRLLQLFIDAPAGELTKQQICDDLWPRKDNASETLYALIHRFKPILEAHSDLRIESLRGRAYRLVWKSGPQSAC